jgi:hypothetical protein
VSALRRYDPLTMRPVLIFEEPRTPVPLPGFSLRGHAVVGRSGRYDSHAAEQRAYKARKAAKA